MTGDRPTSASPSASRSRLACSWSRARSTQSSPSFERAGDGRLERRARHVGQELLDSGDPGDELGGAQRPADLPAGGRKGLSGRGDANGSLPHPREPGQRQVLGVVEGQVLVDLVTDDEHVMRHRQSDDLGEIVPIQHHAGGIVRAVDDDGLGALGESGGQLGMIQPEVRPEDTDTDPATAGEVDRGGVRVVERLQGDHLVAGVDERQDRRGQGLGGAGGDQDLGIGVVAQAVMPSGVVGDRGPQRRDPAARRVLVDSGRDRRLRLLQHEVGPVAVRETLAEVDRLRLDGQCRHLREDRGGR